MKKLMLASIVAWTARSIALINRLNSAAQVGRLNRSYYGDTSL